MYLNLFIHQSERSADGDFDKFNLNPSAAIELLLLLKAQKKSRFCLVSAVNEMLTLLMQCIQKSNISLSRVACERAQVLRDPPESFLGRAN